MTENIQLDNSQISTGPRRGGCLSAYLIVMIILNAILAVYYLLAGEAVQHSIPGIPEWSIYILGIVGILNTIFAIYVWKWKKIGVMDLQEPPWRYL